MGGLMKTSFKRIAAISASAVLAVCSSGLFSAMGAEPADEPITYTVHFDLSDPDLFVVEEEDGTVPEFNDIVTNGESSIFIPNGKVDKEGYSFSGWTADGVYGYKGGDVYRVTDSDVTFTPVWVDENDQDFLTIKYYVEIDGEEVDISKYFSDYHIVKGRFLNISLMTFSREGYKQRGWTDGEHVFAGQQNMIIPDHDVTLTPNWLKLYTLHYTVGDADRVTGVTFLDYENTEGNSTNLQSSTRFSRKGFTIRAWYCDYDQKEYLPDAKFIMPSSDVTMYPVWEPIKYTVVFKPGTGSSDNIKIPGYTDTTIEVPDINVEREGLVFAGWSYEGKIYQPGEEFFIEGAAPGLGIALSAVWTEKKVDEEDVVYGDANCDGYVDLSDAILIMQALSNPNRYGLNGSEESHITEQGWKNADCSGNNDGVRNSDALAIQKFLIGALEDLPEGSDNEGSGNIPIYVPEATEEE